MKEKYLNKESLKALFDDGCRPTGSNFASLIESTINKLDDGISKNLNDGLILSTETSEDGTLLSFFKSVQDDIPQWCFSMSSKDGNGLEIKEMLPKEPEQDVVPPETEPASDQQSADEPEEDKYHATSLFLKKGGSIGVNTNKPLVDFEVNGILGSSGRMGTYKMSSIPADGRWHNIVENLDSCCAFEIMAQVGKQKSGKYALLHAHALSTFGRSHSKIRKTQAHYGFYWNKIALRWVGTTFKYNLQMRTRSNYGKDETIKYYMTKLWDNNILSLLENTK